MDFNRELPINNLGLAIPEAFIGRNNSLQTLRNWLKTHPVLAISGPSGVGKTALAMMLAVQEAARFDQGIFRISATGNERFHFYDIVRDIEQVLGSGITRRPVDDWGILVLQQLYGFKRLLILDEVTEASGRTIEKLVDWISLIGPGGQGRFILVGRTIPPPLLALAEDAHLKLSGLRLPSTKAWVQHYRGLYNISTTDSETFYQITAGHPIALKMIAGLWQAGFGQDKLVALSSEPWPARLQTIVATTLDFVEHHHSQAFRLLLATALAAGGFSGNTLTDFYWPGVGETVDLGEAVAQLLRFGLLIYNPGQDRYNIHPLVRRYVTEVRTEHFERRAVREQLLQQARYYLPIARRYAYTSPNDWADIDVEWGNIQAAVMFVVDLFGRSLKIEFPAALSLKKDHLPILAPSVQPNLRLLLDYVLALRNYLLWRHPTAGQEWVAAGLIAAQYLLDPHAEAILAGIYAALAYFMRDYITAEKWYRQAVAFFERRGDQHQQLIQLLRDLGTTLRAAGKPEQALACYDKALVVARDYGTRQHIATLQMVIGSLHYAGDAYNKALVCHKQALFDAQHYQDAAWQAIHHNNIGLTLEAKGDLGKAISHYRKAIKLHQQVENQQGLSTSYGNLGAAYYNLKALEKALDAYEQDFFIRGQRGEWLDQAAILHNMGHIALELHDWLTAAEYIAQSLYIYKEFGQQELAEEEQKLLALVHEQRAAGVKF